MNNQQKYFWDQLSRRAKHTLSRYEIEDPDAFAKYLREGRPYRVPPGMSVECKLMMIPGVGRVLHYQLIRLALHLAYLPEPEEWYI
jgi:hypothetical protein